MDEGSDLTWRCDASGKDGNGPQVTYKWLKNGDPLEEQASCDFVILKFK